MKSRKGKKVSELTVKLKFMVHGGEGEEASRGAERNRKTF